MCPAGKVRFARQLSPPYFLVIVRTQFECHIRTQKASFSTKTQFECEKVVY